MSSKIRNPKSEIRNKFEYQKAEKQPRAEAPSDAHFFPSFEFRICFGFRHSDFEFPDQACLAW